MDDKGLTSVAGPSRTSFTPLPSSILDQQDEQHGQIPMVATPAAPRRTAVLDGSDHSLLRRAGGGTNADQNIAQTGGAASDATAMSANASETPTTSQSDLFPTASQKAESGDGGRGTNVYYLVFLGVLVVLLCVAACLTYRAFRIRRRFRTATQRAIARGDRLPPELTGDRDDFWGLGGLAGWNSDGMDRFPLAPGGHVLVGGAGSKWKRVPMLWEHVVEPDPVGQGTEGEGRALVSGSRRSADIWGDTQPLVVQSLLPPDEDLDRSTAAESSHPWRAIPRMSSPRPRSSHRLQLSSFPFGHRRRPHDLPSDAPVHEDKVPEMDRYLEDGEEIRIGVVIEMPTEDTDLNHRRSFVDSEDGEEIGWKPNMEIGVWEGSARRRYR